MARRATKLAELMAAPLNGYSQEAHDRKERFHKEGKLVMRRLAEALGLARGTFDIRSNKAGMAVSGEVTLHSDRYYVQAGKTCRGPRGNVLFRLCDGRKDYCGKTNNFATADELEDVKGFARRLRALVR